MRVGIQNTCYACLLFVLRQPDQQHRNIARRDAGNAPACPMESGRISASTRLDAKPRDGKIVDAVRQSLFPRAKAPRPPLLALDIARILHLNLDRLCTAESAGRSGSRAQGPAADLQGRRIRSGKARRSLTLAVSMRKQYFVERRAFCNAGRLRRLISRSTVRYFSSTAHTARPTPARSGARWGKAAGRHCPAGVRAGIPGARGHNPVRLVRALWSRSSISVPI